LITLSALPGAEALINVPVSQKSNFMNFVLQDTHAYFDISYEGQGNLIQADNNATYMFSKICTYYPTQKLRTYLISIYSLEKCQQIPVRGNNS
jgi:hypothetical protein